MTLKVILVSKFKNDRRFYLCLESSNLEVLAEVTVKP